MNLGFELERASPVELTLYDVSGRPVHVLENSQLLGGEHLKVVDVSGFSEGVYFVVMTTSDTTYNVKVVFVK